MTAITPRGARPDMLGDPPMIGREPTMATLMDAVDQASHGGSGLYLLSGEPGVGKTRIMHELLARARAAGCHVMHGRAQEYDGSIAYAVLKDALASLDAPAQPAPVRRELAELIEATERAVTEGSVESQSPYVRTARLLRALLDSGPVVLALDDADLSDGETLAALALALRHLRNRPLLAVLAVRRGRWLPGSPFAAIIGRFVDDGAGTVIDVDPLDHATTRSLIGTALDGRPDDRLVDYVHERSGGVPLFAREALHSLLAQGSIRSEAGRLYLAGNPSAGVVSQRGALLHRIFQQDENARRLARVMSTFKVVHLDQLPLLTELTGLATDTVQDAFDTLAASAIVVRVDGGGFEFGHPLMAEVLYEDLGPVERRRVHTAVFEHLSSHPDRRVGALELATHAVEAAEPGDLGAIAAAQGAARLTSDSAPLCAARWLEQVLNLLGPESAKVGETLSRQTRAYWKGSRPDLAIETGLRAAEHLPPGPQRTANAVTVVNVAYAMGHLDDAATLSERLLADTGSAAALAQRGLILAHLGRTDDARAITEQAWQKLRRVDSGERAVAYSYLATTENLIGTDERTASALQLLRRVALDDDSLTDGARLSALESWAYVRGFTDAPIELDELAAYTAALGERVGWNDLGGQAVTTLARTQYLTGDWADALETIRSGAIALEYAGLNNNLAWLRLLEIDILLAQGLHSTAEDVLHSVVLPDNWIYWRAQRAVLQARIELVRRYDDDTVAHLHDLLRQAVEAGWNDVIRDAVDALVEITLDQGSTAPLAACRTELRMLDETSRTTKVRVAAATGLALLGDPPGQGAALLTRSTTSTNPLPRGRAHYVLAVLGHDPSASLNAALADFEAIGARSWSRRVNTHGRRHGISLDRARPRVEKPNELADIDRQLVQLVRDGLNNRQIAEIMHYSRKTVEAYLSRLYRRTGSHSRISLVLTAEREGWLEPDPGPAAEQ